MRAAGLRRAAPSVGAPLAALAVATAVGVAAAYAPPAMLVAAPAGLLLALVVFAHPPFGAYLLIGGTPLVAGIDRGKVIPLLRPSEALMLLVLGALLARGGLRFWSGNLARPRLGRVDAAILLLAITGSVIPLAWMWARGVAIEQDDLLYALQLWKYYAIFLLIRASVTTVRQVERCLWVSLAAGAGVGVIAILQSLQLFGVPGLLAEWYAPFEQTRALENQRGTSLLASSGAVADVMVFNLAVAAAWILRGGARRDILAVLAVVFVFGTLAAGQFAGFAGLLIGVCAVGFITGRLGRVGLAFGPVAIVASVALWPVIEKRISGFESAAGLPSSWIARLENLQTHFWPKLFDDFNWVMGVRPAARVPGFKPWEDFVFIESGHTWLLWTGGIPFALAFVGFLVVAMTRVGRVARRRFDAIGIAAVGSFTALAVLAVLMIADPHLTLRGSADLSFTLLALALVRPSDAAG